MSINIDTNALFPFTGRTQRNAIGHSRDIQESATGNSTVEKEEDGPQKSSFGSLMQRQLTPDEQRRVEFLKNLLVQTLAMAQGDPTDEQKQRIREIEDELEKLTGVKMRSRISNITDKMPGEDDEQKEKRKQEQQARGIDPKDAVHSNIELKMQSDNPGMQIMQRTGLSAYLKGIGVAELGELTSIKA